MSRLVVAVLAGAFLLGAPALARIAVKPPILAPKRVYKIDSVIATLSHGHLSIQVKGAVPSGGWKTAHLKLEHAPADPHTLVIDFLATPPPTGAPVIQGLLPVSANLVVPMRRGVVTVRAVSDANEMTTQILK